MSKDLSPLGSLEEALAEARAKLPGWAFAAIRTGAPIEKSAGGLSREYLEEAWSLARKMLPPWAWAQIHSQAKPKAGARANAERDDAPTPLEKVALEDIRPRRLRSLTDEDLRATWLRLNEWFASAQRRKRAVENVVNAALWAAAEMRRRGFEIDETTEMMRQVAQLRERTQGERAAVVDGMPGEIPAQLAKLLENQPDEILLVRDWASVAGSAAVTEKPNDIDVVVRMDYDNERGKFLLDGSSVHVALRRFLAPDKAERDIQVLASPSGSFTDYVPLYDLVARRREHRVERIEPQPPAYEGQERVIKQAARAASPEVQAQAERAKGDDSLTLGEFFFMPKPTRPTQPDQQMTVDALVELLAKDEEAWSPAVVQKKYDGVRHQIHKDGDHVVIYSEDGGDNTARLPSIAAAIKSLDAKQLVLDCEIERWRDGQHLPRETVAGYLAERGEPDDSELVANLFDVLYIADEGGGDLHKESLEARLKYLDALPIAQRTMGAPEKGQALNLAPSRVVDSLAELREAVEEIRYLPGSEGAVVKQADSAYPLDVATQDTWGKFHNATLISALVVAKKETEAGAYVYTYGVLEGEVQATQTVDVGEQAVVVVGDSFATSYAAEVGDRLLVEAETVNLAATPKGLEITAWVPRVLGTYEGAPDTVQTAAERADAEYVLQIKRVDEEGNVTYLPPTVRKAEQKPEVPTAGKEGALVMFVGASPNETEAARKEPFVGAAGETFNELYLKPLGVSRSDVALSNAVPLLLRNDEGHVREPDVAEVKAWREWLAAEVDRIAPQMLVALGRTAEGALEAALGRPADFVLPHPSAVRRRGDSGETGRKLRRARELLAERKKTGERVRSAKIAKQPPKPLIEEGEEETRGEAAFDSWEKNWHELLPKSGTGRFVYQHHWRGLSQDEAEQLNEKQLFQTDHSVHGDIRLEGEDGQLWGWAVLLGRAEDNKALPHRDKLIDLEVARRTQPGDKIELAPKLPQPAEWLDVGKPQPMIMGPGEVGSTSEKFSKFFAVDGGTYSLGVARQHAVEIFLDGKFLQGRYLLQFAPVAARRRWMIDKPADQEPMATKRSLADVLAELKRKKQQYLIWGVPGGATEKIDVATGEVAKSALVPLLKGRSLEDKRIVYGVVLDPYVIDAHDDWVPPEVVEDTAHGWFKKTRMVTLDHRTHAEAQAVESWIVEYPSRSDYESARLNEPHRVLRRKYGEDHVHSGAWLIGVELSPELWEAYKRDEIAAFSIEGFGMRTPATRQAMPHVTYVDVVEVKNAK